jgi:hypothetical protein
MEKIIDGSELRKGNTRSCTCPARELRSKRLIKHGESYTRNKRQQLTILYNCWIAMKNRCFNPKNNAYKNYGGRGITVCEEWKNNYGAFRDWAINNGWIKGLSIDRIDNGKGYFPENCRWATAMEQANNKRINRLETINGLTKTIAEWAREYDIPCNTVRNRLRDGWPLMKALTARDGIQKAISNE